jgi:hypothetical protein
MKLEERKMSESIALQMEMIEKQSEIITTQAAVIQRQSELIALLQNDRESDNED